MSAERELAAALADLIEWSARPIDSFPKHPHGKPLEGQLRVYGPVQPSNVQAATNLQGMLFNDKLRDANRRWAELPEHVRRRVELEARCIQIERLLDKMEIVIDRIVARSCVGPVH